MTDPSTPNQRSSSKVSRRKVGLGTVWAVPIILAVGAAPAWAASSLVNASARMNRKAFIFTVTTTGARPTDTVTITSVVGTPALKWTGSGSPINKPATIVSNRATINGEASSNAHTPPVTYTVNYTVTGLGALTTTFTY